MDTLASRSHNKSKCRREDKKLLRTLRNPKKREKLMNYLAQESALSLPFRRMQPLRRSK